MPGARRRHPSPPRNGRRGFPSSPPSSMESERPPKGVVPHGKGARWVPSSSLEFSESSSPRRRPKRPDEKPVERRRKPRKDKKKDRVKHDSGSPYGAIRITGSARDSDLMTVHPGENGAPLDLPRGSRQQLRAITDPQPDTTLKPRHIRPFDPEALRIKPITTGERLKEPIRGHSPRRESPPLHNAIHAQRVVTSFISGDAQEFCRQLTESTLFRLLGQATLPGVVTDARLPFSGSAIGLSKIQALYTAYHRYVHIISSVQDDVLSNVSGQSIMIVSQLTQKHSYRNQTLTQTGPVFFTCKYDLSGRLHEMDISMDTGLIMSFYTQEPHRSDVLSELRHPVEPYGGFRAEPPVVLPPSPRVKPRVYEQAQ